MANIQSLNYLPNNPGFDMENGRLDVSVHPFTGGAHPTDVRMTTRFKADDLTEGLTGVQCSLQCAERVKGTAASPTCCPGTQLARTSLASGAVHETGHALYEQGRNLSDEWKDLPVNSVRGVT